MVANTDRALALACEELDCAVTEYTVAPVFIKAAGEQGAHEWIVEFNRAPLSLEAFAKTLDRHLQDINSDYAAKRRGDMALVRLIVNAVPAGTFHTWMAKRGKLGGQGKVPRLSNDRKHLEAILRTGTAHQRSEPALIAELRG